MMRILLTILAFLLATQGYGQKYPGLEKALATELPKKASIDGRWVFYNDDTANIEKLNKPLINAVVPHYQLYKVVLTNFLGMHINQGTCIILFDSSASKIILIPPLWYSGMGEPLLKPLMQAKFDSKKSIVNSLREFNELMEIGSSFKFVITGKSDTLITYDLVRYDRSSPVAGIKNKIIDIHYSQDDVWRKIKVKIENNRIVKYTAINPVMNTEETVN